MKTNFKKINIWIKRKRRKRGNFLQNKILPPSSLEPKVNEKKWEEKNNIIYFTVTTKGWTGKKWIKHLRKKGIIVNNPAKKMLLSKQFKSIPGEETQVAIMKNNFWDDNKRTPKKYRNQS